MRAIDLFERTGKTTLDDIIFICVLTHVLESLYISDFFLYVDAQRLSEDYEFETAADRPWPTVAL